ncbi:MAG: TPM domain-containing protein [Bacteroidia bacterium]|nr:TPM domain-containing protein [Bacteroidia bacterium]
MKTFAIILGLIFCAFSMSGQDARADKVPDPPSPYRWVVNLSEQETEFISTSGAQTLHNTLEEFAVQTSNQIVVLIVDDYNGLSGIEYATEVGRKWGVGGKDKDNGVVVLIDPAGGEGEKNITIAVGHGLEGAIPDIYSKQIEQEMIAYFKTGNSEEGIIRGVTLLMDAAKGEYTEFSGQSVWSIPTWYIILAFLIGILALAFFTKGGGGGTISRGGWHGRFGGFSSFGGFGGGGGGFSSGGFGGGSFGGGGSSSNW